MMSDHHEHGAHPGHPAKGQSTNPDHETHSGESRDFGVTKVTVTYHWKGVQYEVDLDPNRIDIMIFGSDNIKRFKPHLPEPVGGPVTKNLNHLMPDGTMRKHDPKSKTEYWPAEKAGIFGTPRKVRMAVSGSPDDFCWHNELCNWWCVAGDHSPLEE
jgi:hypothetical protein